MAKVSCRSFTAIGFVCAMACMLAPRSAKADISIDVVLVLGIEVAPKQVNLARDKQTKLAALGIKLFEDPSMSDGLDPKPTMTTFAGRVLSRRATGHNTSQATSNAVPTSKEVAALTRQLKDNGLQGDVKIIALIAYSGGK
jgi:hypothetical protein